MEFELNTRKRIFETIRSSPGIHLRELERTLGLAVGSLQYHLHYMQKKNLIFSQKDEQFIRYFVKDKELSDSNRIVMSFLRKKACRHILITLMGGPGLNNKDISTAIGLSPSTVSWHLNKLVASRIINKTINGRESNFNVNDPEEIAELVITYKSSFFDRMLDNFIEMWELDTGKQK